MANVIAKVNLRLKIKSLEELKAMGITSGAMLVSDHYYDKFLNFCQLEFDSKTINKANGKYSGFHLREETMRIPVECISFDFNKFRDDNPECFI